MDSAVGENMNLLNINAKDLNILGNNNEKGKIDYSFLVNEGDILEGVVSDNNKVCINVNGKEITVDNSSTENSNTGDVKKYQVLNRSKDKLILQEVKENTGVNEKIDINSKINSAEIKQDYFTQEIKKSISDAKSAIADNDMEQQLTEKLDKSVIIMSPEDLRAIEEDGKNIEDMDIEEIHKKITKINREKVENQNTNCGIVDKNVDNLSNWQNTMSYSQKDMDNSAQNVDIVREKRYQCGILIENTDFKQQFQQKINIDFIDENGELYCKGVTKNPQIFPYYEKEKDLGLYNLTASLIPEVSSIKNDHFGIYITDESNLTYWQPDDNDIHPSIVFDLGGYYQISSFRIWFRDVYLNYKENKLPKPIPYIVKALINDEYVTIVDNSNPQKELNIDYVTFDDMTTSKVKLELLTNEIGIIDFSLFGKMEIKNG